MLDPRLNHIVAVARCGSFTAAAQAIGVTQSAVTKGVADLERQLGYAVFHRTKRGALLTEKGSDFVERASRLLDDARELLEGSPNSNDPYAGTLRIGVCPASLEWRLIAPLSNLLYRYPDMRFEVGSSSFERMVLLLRNGGVDVALGLDAAFADWSDLRREPVPELEFTLFVRRGHPALAETPISIADLAQYDFVSPSDSRPFGANIRNIYESQGLEWRSRLHVIDYFPTVRRIVASSDAIGAVSLSHIGSPSFQRHFVVLDHLVPFEPARMCCAVRARWEAKPAVRAFIAAVQADAPARSQFHAQ